MRILYIASASIIEPLIESQVVRYLENLASKGCSFDLVTFERNELEPDAITQISNRLSIHAIHWKPHWISSAQRSFGLLNDIRNTTRELVPWFKENPVDLIHARSFLPGNIAVGIKKKLGTPVLYDMRGLWAKEKFAYGRIKLLPAKWLAQAMENRVIRSADYLVSLTNNGIKYLQEKGVNNPIECIPCCVDLDHFRPAECRLPTDPIRLISVGSLGKGYRCDAVFKFAVAFSRLHSKTHLDLFTRTDPNHIIQIANTLGVPESSYSIRPVPHCEVAAEIANATLGICMVEPSESKIASCPTKLGEYLACGLPVVANVPIGDVEEILSRNQVGVSVRLDQDSFDDVAKRAFELIQSSSIQQRARAVAEEIFDVESGAAKYYSIYEKLCHE